MSFITTFTRQKENMKLVIVTLCDSRHRAFALADVLSRAAPHCDVTVSQIHSSEELIAVVQRKMNES